MKSTPKQPFAARLREPIDADERPVAEIAETSTMPTKSTPTFDGRKVEQAREQAQMTRAQLADAAKVSRQMIRLIEIGDHVPNVNTVYRIAHTLGVSVEQLGRD